ncbi:TfoX/Sxy family protein [Mesorhizobium sp. M0051]|uniref:TfoX/Sxy family DNA transformation protein n=1 Tax=unclassified Mesorhizobium TaxID=325217 RepID=UPI000A07943E|nr:TfoX/Sxy family DNA transformation protein [Mesorhizobium sp. LNHC252B00]
MSTRIEDMRNLGPATARMLAEIDVLCEEDLRGLGAVEAYHRLKFRFGQHITINALYAMEAAIRGCDWRALDSGTKEHLRRQARYVIARQADPAE